MDQTIGLRKIKNIIPREGQEWSVIAYVISSEVVDGFHGLWFLIGTYSKRKKAIKTAEKLINETGIKSIYAMKTCEWNEINEKTITDRTILVEEDVNNIDSELLKIQKKEHETLKRKYEDDQILKEELRKTIEYEQTEGTIEHYTRQWYLMIKQYETINFIEKKLEENKNTYKKMIDNIKKLDNNNPSYQENWLNKLTEFLPKRGEEDLLELLIEKHKAIITDLYKTTESVK